MCLLNIKPSDQRCCSIWQLLQCGLDAVILQWARAERVCAGAQCCAKDRMFVFRHLSAAVVWWWGCQRSFMKTAAGWKGEGGEGLQTLKGREEHSAAWGNVEVLLHRKTRENQGRREWRVWAFKTVSGKDRRMQPRSNLFDTLAHTYRLPWVNKEA